MKCIVLNDVEKLYEICFYDLMKKKLLFYTKKYEGNLFIKEGVEYVKLFSIKNGCEIDYRREKLKAKYTGLYQRDDYNFIALYPTPEGPMIYYNNKEYPISKELHIYVKKDGKDREFIIEEYGIHMNYKESEYLDFDVWSTEMDVDLCWRISQLYKKDDFYKDYTKDVYCREEDILQANKD